MTGIRTIDLPENRLTNLTLRALNPQIGFASLQSLSPTRALITLSTTGGQPFLGTDQAAQFHFTALPNPSGFVPLPMDNIIALKADGNPVTRWMLSNVAIKTDPAGSIKVDKDKSGDKVDGIVADIMSLAAVIMDDTGGPSVYEDRGVLDLDEI